MSEPGGSIFPDVPETVEPDRKYLFYMHGAWPEMKGLDQPHPKFGIYEYGKIVRVLSEKGFIVISEVRTGMVDMKQYSGKVVSQVQSLLNRGVPVENITVIGHSKGGYMALMAAGMLKEPKMNFVIMAGCGKDGTPLRQVFEKFLDSYSAQLQGHILSLYDESDRMAGSCREAFDRASEVQTGEIVLKTGHGHGLFFSPDPVWINEVSAWAGL